MAVTGTQTLGERYGRPSPQRRRVAVALTAVAALLLVAWTAWAGLLQARSNDVSGEVRGFRVLDARTVEVDLRVRRPADGAAVCHLRSLDVRFATVGLADVTVGPEGPRDQLVTATIRTLGEATTAELLRCEASDG